jgi:SAM-dependent methyltransferase
MAEKMIPHFSSVLLSAAVDPCGIFGNNGIRRRNGMNGGNYDHIAAIYEKIFPLSEEALAFISGRAGGRGAEVLDAGCGTGELAISLQKSGYKVTAFDLEPSMIEKAEKRRKEEALAGPRFLSMGMEEMSSRLSGSSYSLISCIGNTIAHLDGPAAADRFLSDASDLLIPGGSLVLQLLNYGLILETRPAALPPIELEGYRFLRFYDYSALPGSLVFTTRLEDPEGVLLDERRVRLFPLTDTMIGDALSGIGFGDIRFFGGFSGEAPGKGRLPLVVSAVRK